MAEPFTAIIECVNPDASLPTFDGLKIIIDGFFGVLPSLALPDLVPKLAADINFDVKKIPSFVVDLLFKSFGTALPSFKMTIPELDIDLSYSGIDIPGFDPAGLIKLILGLLKLAVGIPELFFDFDKKVPKIPSIDDLNLGIEFPDFSSLPGFEDFAIRFPKCVMTAVTSVILP